MWTKIKIMMMLIRYGPGLIRLMSELATVIEAMKSTDNPEVKKLATTVSDMASEYKKTKNKRHLKVQLKRLGKRLEKVKL